MIVEATELQKFKLGANVFLLVCMDCSLLSVPQFYIFIYLFIQSFIYLFFAVWFYRCFLFFLKFSLSLLGCLPCWGLQVFVIWLFQLN